MTSRLDGAMAEFLSLDAACGLAADEVAVSPRFAPGSKFALLEANPGEPLGTVEAVRLVRDEAVPDGLVAASEVLAGRIELGHEGASWRLRTDGIEYLQATELQLELGVECGVEDAVSRLNKGARIRGAALLVRDADVEATSLEIDGLGLRVARVEPAPGDGASLIEITDQTRLSLLVPGTRTGVDVVVLADCSGSMSLDDLAVSSGEGGAKKGLFGFRRTPKTRSMTRMEAVRIALDRLLQVRLESTGRASRMAVVEFTDRCVQVFPRAGGMVEVDGNASADLIREYRDAVQVLDSRDAGTSIGNAIRTATELLVRHGRQTNERLIVLISDGADWAPKKPEDAGEMVIGADEPVSLMEGYHQSENLRIHLHAIGVSEETIFSRWWRSRQGSAKPQAWMIPNHRLLEELVKVGGGDPARTGDTDVLLDYFSKLGSGIERALRCEARNRDGALREAGRQQIRAQSGGIRMDSWKADLQAIAERALHLVTQINEFAIKLANKHAFQLPITELRYFNEVLPKMARDEESFSAWILKLYQKFIERREERIFEAQADYPVPDIRSILHGDATGMINELRVFYAHDPDVDTRPGKRRKSESKREKMAALLERLIGRPVFDENDANAWCELQLAVARLLQGVLEDAEVVYRRAFTEKAARPEPAPELAASGRMRILFHQPSRSRR